MSGSSNTVLGYNAGSNVTTASNVICIGTSVTGENASNSSIRDVSTQNVNAIPVLIDSAGQLGTTSSSARFKKELNQWTKPAKRFLCLSR